MSFQSRYTRGRYKNEFDGVFNFPIFDNFAGKITYNWERGGDQMMYNVPIGRRLETAGLPHRAGPASPP